MHICLVSAEIFAWGKYGGFGRATRILGKELCKRGVKVSAIVPLRSGQNPVEKLDGIHVFGFPRSNPLAVINLAKQINADIYHAQEPSTISFFTHMAMPLRPHVITCRDTRTWSDWVTEFRYPTKNHLQVISNWLFEDNLLVRQSVRKATVVAAASYLMSAKAFRHYRLLSPPRFLPTPVYMPDNIPQKAKRPTVCFVARWDRRKRPEIFFALAKQFPKVQFIAVGASHDKAWDTYLRRKYSNLPNLEMPGFVNQFASERLNEIYAKSWILVNTAAREGLPNSFIEASAHGCAILSSVDPDNFASRFGYYAANDEFEAGLQFLLENKRWEIQGRQGYAYVKNTFSIEEAVQRHLDLYHDILSIPRQEFH